MRRPRLLASAVLLLVSGLLLLVHVRVAHAIPEGGSIGIRTLDEEGQVIGGVNVLITHVAGDYPMDPILVTTEFPGLVWVSVETGTYSIVALDDDLEPIEGTEIILFVPSGAHDIIVVIQLPPACAADADDDGAVGVTDLLALLAVWGTPLGDLDGDGTTGVTDMLALLAQWGACE